jgi:hypothetical protein
MEPSVLEGARKPTGPEALQMHRRRVDPIVSARFSGSQRVSGLFSCILSHVTGGWANRRVCWRQAVSVSRAMLPLPPRFIQRAIVVFTVAALQLVDSQGSRLHPCSCLSLHPTVCWCLSSHPISLALPPSLPPCLWPSGFTFPVSDCRDRKERAEDVVIEKFIDYSAM